ncbi:MAG: hypothetical protein II298_01005, partial [Bacteroidales bacterium]|nr:hypothetical protein [Bacteroidales bacterium]
IHNLFLNNNIDIENELYITNIRHLELLKKSKESLENVLYNIDSCSVYKIENNNTIHKITWHRNYNTNSTNKNFFSEKEWHLLNDSLNIYSLYFVITEEDLNN